MRLCSTAEGIGPTARTMQGCVGSTRGSCCDRRLSCWVMPPRAYTQASAPIASSISMESEERREAERNVEGNSKTENVAWVYLGVVGPAPDVAFSRYFQSRNLVCTTTAGLGLQVSGISGNIRQFSKFGIEEPVAYSSPCVWQGIAPGSTLTGSASTTLVVSSFHLYSFLYDDPRASNALVVSAIWARLGGIVHVG